MNMRSNEILEEYDHFNGINIQRGEEKRGEEEGRGGEKRRGGERGVVERLEWVGRDDKRGSFLSFL